MTDSLSSRPLYYDALKVSRDAPDEVIRAAYRSLSQKYHPDRNVGDEYAYVMAALNQAYEVLSHPEKKLEYDAWIRQESLRADKNIPHEPEQGKVVSRRAPRLPALLTGKRMAAGAFLLACCAAVVAYSTGQKSDPWLERAWHESWRSDLSSFAEAQPAAPGFSRTDAAADSGSVASTALKWEDALTKSPSHSGRDVRF